MPDLINWEILKNPYNWIVVVLMTAFALILLHIIMPEAPTDAASV